MGMNLSTVAAKTATVTVEWEDETVEVHYHPAAMTPALMDRVTEAAKRDSMDTVGILLEPVLSSWDVYEDDAAQERGERVATDAERIATIPLAFSMKVLNTIAEAMRPPAGRG